jgi:preprotein translocase subunit SecE
MAEAKKRVGPIKFLQQVDQERRRVTWTPWKETLVTTIMVFIMVVFMAIFFFFADLIVSSALRFGLRLLGAGA